MEVCAVSRGMMLLPLNPYPPHYKVAFAFSIFLCLLPYRHFLQFGFPYGRATGLPRSVWIPV